jgi:glutathione S-transferase
MIKLYDSAFSPFARKVRMALEYKGLNYDAVDGLIRSNHEALKDVNARIEVPALVDDDVVVINSSDIVAYLDHRYPAKCIYPDGPAARVHARAWERVADTFVDPILVDISYWKWAERSDTMPEGLLEAARADLRLVRRGPCSSAFRCKLSRNVSQSPNDWARAVYDPYCG